MEFEFRYAPFLEDYLSDHEKAIFELLVVNEYIFRKDEYQPSNSDLIFWVIKKIPPKQGSSKRHHLIHASSDDLLVVPRLDLRTLDAYHAVFIKRVAAKYRSDDLATWLLISGFQDVFAHLGEEIGPVGMHPDYRSRHRA